MWSSSLLTSCASPRRRLRESTQPMVSFRQTSQGMWGKWEGSSLIRGLGFLGLGSISEMSCVLGVLGELPS